MARGNGQLMARATGQLKFPFFAESETSSSSSSWMRKLRFVRTRGTVIVIPLAAVNRSDNEKHEIRTLLPMRATRMERNMSSDPSCSILSHRKLSAKDQLFA